MGWAFLAIASLVCVVNPLASAAESSTAKDKIVLGPNAKLVNEFIQAVGNDAEAAKLFLKNNKDFLKDGEGSTALVESAKRGHGRVVEVLLSKGANIQGSDSKGRTAVHFAALCSKQHHVRHGICPEEVGYKGEEYDSHHDTMERLVRFEGSPMDAVDDEGRTALMYAAMQGHSDIVDVLLENGADPTISDKSGWSAIFYCALYNREKILEKLLKDGRTDINSKDLMGYVPLVTASEQGWKQSVLILLSFGANPLIKCRNGKLPSEHARGFGHTEIAEILQEYERRSEL